MGPLEAFDRYCSMVVVLRNRDEAVRLVEIVRKALTGPVPMLTHFGMDYSQTTTHIMERGSTLCGIHTRPVDWPPNEQWVPIDSAESATCCLCMDVFVKRNVP